MGKTVKVVDNLLWIDVQLLHHLSREVDVKVLDDVIGIPLRSFIIKRSAFVMTYTEYNLVISKILARIVYLD